MNALLRNRGARIVLHERVPRDPSPLGRRCPVGADEGAFTYAQESPPHQFGQMTYGRAVERMTLDYPGNTRP
jgi:hypothetical protein